MPKSNVTDEATQQAYEALRRKLVDARTMQELLAAVDDDFKAEVARLPQDLQRILRDTFSIQRDEVKHRVKMDALVGHIVIVTDPPEFPTPNPQFGGEFCVIKGRFEGTQEPFECRSSAKRIVRHFRDSASTTFPQRLEFYRESADAMKARDAKPIQQPDGSFQQPSPMWLVRKLTPLRAASDGIPF